MSGADIVHIHIPRTVFGAGAVRELGTLVKSFTPHKVLVVSGPDVAGAGIAGRVTEALAGAGISTALFDGCAPWAPASVVLELADTVRQEGYDLLVAAGGGSTMDAVKASALLAADAGLSLDELLSPGGRAPAASIRKIMVPTTAGSGSEWSWAAVVTNDIDDGRVRPYVTQMNYPDAVVIDPDLSLELPAATTAQSGVDALGHAIEAYTSCRANVVSDMFAAQAIELVGRSLRPAFAKGCRAREHRSDLAFAAAAAMVAVCSSGVGLAHFMNDALSQRAQISHGSCVGLMLPYVMEFNLVSNPPKFAEVARLLGEPIEGLSVMEAADLAADAVRRLLSDLGMPLRLRDVGVGEADIPDLVEDLIQFQSVPITLMNPREVGREDATAIYSGAL